MLFSAQNGLLSTARETYELQTPCEGRSEQAPEDWWTAVVKTVREVCRALPRGGQVTALSLSLQGGTLVVTDKNFHPLRPAVVWNDHRCTQEANRFRERFGGQYLYEHSGWQLGKGLNALQILWLREHEREIFNTAAYFLSVPDYISAKLTGIPALDLSNAGINQLLDLSTGAYNQEVLDFIGITEERLGHLVPSGEVIGRLTAHAASELGLTEETLLVSGAHDQYAVAAGAGCGKAGDVLIGTGTAWVVTALSGCPNFSSGFSQSVAAGEGVWGSLVSMPSGGISLEWFRKKLASTGEPLSYEDIDRLASASAVGARGVMFHPYFSGSPRPEPEGTARAALTGLDLSHTNADIARAVKEGVTFQMAWILEQFREHFPITRLLLSGGAAKSALWSQIIAEVTGMPLRVPEAADLACVGAAVLAGKGSGVFASLEEGQRRLSVGSREIIPDPARTAVYQELFEEYKDTARYLNELYRSRRKKGDR